MGLNGVRGEVRYDGEAALAVLVSMPVFVCNNGQRSCGNDAPRIRA